MSEKWVYRDKYNYDAWTSPGGKIQGDTDKDNKYIRDSHKAQ